jgi:hypothetical protein
MARLKQWLREPLLHFLLIGAALFVAYRALNPSPETSALSNRIELTRDDVLQLSMTWLAQGRPAPTPDQLRNLIELRVREEILYREALALGLDKDDTIVRRRLAQKMEFLVEDVAMTSEPTTDDSRAWYRSNDQRFALPPRVSFHHLYFSFDRHSDRAAETAAAALPGLAGKSSNLPDAASLADPFMFQDYYADRSFDDVAKVFGPGFARALMARTPGSWQGPIESGYGWHLVFVQSIEPSRVPAFEEIEADVKSDLVAEQRTQAKRRAYEAMRARYQVVVPELASKSAAADGAFVNTAR